MEKYQYPVLAYDASYWNEKSRCIDYQQRGLVCIFHVDSGYSIKECRIRLKQGDEISHDTIIQLYLLWPYTDDRKHLLRIYTHQTKLLYGRNMVVEGEAFLLWDLPKQTQNALVSALTPFAQLILPSTSPRAVCMQKGGEEDPKACSDVSMLLLSNLVKKSNFRLFANEWQATSGNPTQLSTFESRRWNQ